MKDVLVPDFKKASFTVIIFHEESLLYRNYFDLMTYKSDL